MAAAAERALVARHQRGLGENLPWQHRQHAGTDEPEVAGSFRSRFHRELVAVAVAPAAARESVAVVPAFDTEVAADLSGFGAPVRESLAQQERAAEERLQGVLQLVERLAEDVRQGKPLPERWKLHELVKRLDRGK